MDRAHRRYRDHRDWLHNDCRSAPPPRTSPQGAGRIAENRGSWPVFSTLGLTLSNPPTIFSFLAVFAGLGVRVGAGWLPAMALVIGVLAGSALWWLVLSGVVALLRMRFSSQVITATGLAAGAA